jgi:hypothetical protein
VKKTRRYALPEFLQFTALVLGFVLAAGSMAALTGCAAEDDYVVVIPDTSDGDETATIDCAVHPDLEICQGDAAPDLTSKTLTPYESAIKWGRDRCLDQYNLHCANTYNTVWLNNCYSWVQATTDATPSQCMDERAAMQYCQSNWALIDPAPPGGGDSYLWGNTGVWYCLGGWPALPAQHRCNTEVSAYNNCEAIY